MKATLTFNLPEDNHEFQAAVNGKEYYNALFEIKEQIRQIWKYREFTEGQYDLIDEIYTLVCDEISKLKQPEL